MKRQPSCCALCNEVLRDPVSTSCGHYVCEQCTESCWEQCNSTGDFSCPCCGKRSRKSPEVQTPTQTSTGLCKFLLFLKQNFFCCFKYIFIISFT
uniref:RING-type domain-containing protein n=1 Tax=Seriola dumerili TaxID=41447 RepID=A0A3B4UZ36_SERDU